MDKLSRSANIVIGIGQLCQAHGLVEEDLPGGLRTILKSLHRYVACDIDISLSDVEQAIWMGSKAH